MEMFTLESSELDEEHLTNLEGNELLKFLENCRRGKQSGKEFNTVLLKNKNYRRMLENEDIRSNFPYIMWPSLIGSPLKNPSQGVLKNSVYSYNDNPLP